MSPNSITAVTHESWFSRIGGAIKGVLVGGLLFLLAICLLFWNEGRAVRTSKSLKEGAAAVIPAAADTVNAAHADKLVHLSGKAVTPETLTDPAFPVSANAIHLRRMVEMLQWTEQTERRTEKKLGGGTETTTTYSYSKNWTSTPIKSATFKQPEGHQNPPELPYATCEWTPKNVNLGAFQLGPSLVTRLDHYTPLPVQSQGAATNSIPAGFRAHNGGYYSGVNPASPQVGDVRVTFQQVEPAEVTVVARQAGTTLAPYLTKAGGSVELLKLGVHSADAMFQAAQKSNAQLTWVLRVVGLLVMFFGLNLVLRPLSVLADVLPMLGDVVSAGTGTIAFLTAGVLSFITIAVAWIVYRPVVGAAILAAAAALAFALKRRLAKQKCRPEDQADQQTLRRAA